MTILELPEELPGWAYLDVDGRQKAALWLESARVVGGMPNEWFVIVRCDGISAFVYPDAIRRG